MTLEITFRPIDVWPGELTRVRRDSPFKAKWASTREILDRELGELNAKNAVLMLALKDRDIALDGSRLRADVRQPAHPGVILAFDSKHGPLKYATDIFEGYYSHQVGWQANTRAIALGLEALRKVDRYGITKRGEQYTGWKALSGAIAMPAALTEDDAIAILHEHAPFAWDWDNPDEVREAYRTGAKILHPDAGGDPEAFRRLTEARDLLIRTAAV